MKFNRAIDILTAFIIVFLGGFFIYVIGTVFNQLPW